MYALTQEEAEKRPVKTLISFESFMTVLLIEGETTTSLSDFTSFKVFLMFYVWDANSTLS